MPSEQSLTNNQKITQYRRSGELPDYEQERDRRLREDLIARIRHVCAEMPEAEFSLLIDHMLRTQLRDIERARREGHRT